MAVLSTIVDLSGGEWVNVRLQVVSTCGQLVVQVAQRVNQTLAGFLWEILPVVVFLLIRPATHNIT